MRRNYIKGFQLYLFFLECNVNILNDKAYEVFDKLSKEEQKKLHIMIIDSPIKKGLFIWNKKT